MRTAGMLAVVGWLVVVTVATGAKELPPPVAPAKGAPPAKATAPAKGTVTALPADPILDALIKDLGADDYRVREKAGLALKGKGELALPYLRQALAGADDPEAVRRLSVLVRKLHYDKLVMPKRITLTMKDKTVREVLDEITKQTGYRIDYTNNGNRDSKVSLKLENVTFWQAIDAVANGSGMQVYADQDDEAIRLFQQNTVSPHVSYAGPFRLVAQNIHSNKNVQLAGIQRGGNDPNRINESISLNFQINSEPKNPILGTTQAEVISAVDETGSSLTVPQNTNNIHHFRSGYYQQPGMRSHNAFSGVNLFRADRTATRIKSLKGKIGVHMLSDTLTDVTIDDVLKVKNKKVLGRTAEVELDSVTEANGIYSANVTLRRVGGNSNPNGQQEDYMWSQSIWQKLELVDDKGVRLQNCGLSSMNNEINSVTVTIQFGENGRGGNKPKAGKPARLVLSEWVQVTQEVTFEFADIPLP